MAPGRARRPSDFKQVIRDVAPDELCPFCPGNEAETPAEILAYRDSGDPDGPGWQVRVFPNKYPAVAGEMGAHEVLVETPEHIASLATMPASQRAAILGAVRERLLAFKADQRWQWASLFKNHGPAAGATREHPHLQLVALPFVPPAPESELNAGLVLRRQTGHCHWCVQIAGASDRCIAENSSFIALAPYASRFPFETHILPKSHTSHFEAIRPEDIPQLADILGEALGRLETVLRGRPYNATLMTAPLQTAALPHYHWRMELIPRLGIMAGFEFGTGCYINSVPPEEAARRLRGAAPG